MGVPALLWSLAVLVIAPTSAIATTAWYDSLIDKLELPAGFSVSVYAEVPAARSLAYNSATGTVFVGAYDFSGIQGRDAQLAVYALRDLDQNHDALGASETVPVTDKISNPNGVSFLNGDLFVAQMDHIDKYADVETDIETLKIPSVVVGTEALPFANGTGLPDTHWHGWRYLTSNPATNKLYVTIGSPCNVPGDGEVLDCNDTIKHPLLGSIAEFNPDGSGLRPVAHGIRNTLGVTFHPKTGDMWFTDNGRDQWGGVWTERIHPQTAVHTPADCTAMGGHWSSTTNCTTSTYSLAGGAGTDEMPPGELNRMPTGGLEHNLDFGFPRCYGRDHPDPSPDWTGVAYNPAGYCPPWKANDHSHTESSWSGDVGSVVDLPPHSATLGLRFYDGNMFPVEYRGRAYYAEHGSWDRSIPSGYAVATASIVNPHTGADEAAIADSTTGPYHAEEFLGGFRFEPPRPCVHTSDCPGNSTCQTRAPAGPGHSGSVQTTYCGGRGRPADLLVLNDGSMLVTDEMNSLVYRVAYNRSAPPLAPPGPPSSPTHNRSAPPLAPPGPPSSPTPDDNKDKEGISSLELTAIMNIALWCCIGSICAVKVLNKRRVKNPTEDDGASAPLIST